MWSGLEPVEGRYDQEYLEVLRRIIRSVGWLVGWLVGWFVKVVKIDFARNFATHGVSVILDLHQVHSIFFGIQN